ATARIGGMATYIDIRPSHGSIEVAYIWFAPFLQRTSQATEALFLMLSYAFDDLGYRRMQWRCNALNKKSRAAPVRLGLTSANGADRPTAVVHDSQLSGVSTSIDPICPHGAQCNAVQRRAARGASLQGLVGRRSSFHRITSSARSRMDSGIVIPRA